MIKFDTEQTIERSAEDVWAYAADVLRHPEWMGVTDVRLVSGTVTEVGARAVERVRMGPRTVDVGMEVSDAIPARRIAWRVSGGGPLVGDVTLDLEPLGPDRTKAVYSGAIGLSGIWRLIEPFMAREIAAGEAAELRRLKDNLEAAPASPTG